MQRATESLSSFAGLVPRVIGNDPFAAVLVRFQPALTWCRSDRSRASFTLDDGPATAVKEAFVTLYDRGLIYQDTYLVNWSTALQTAVSDLEVSHRASDEPLTS